jgi:hypothetical protein
LSTLRYHKTAERPSAELWLEDIDGTLIDFASGYTFSLKIGNKGSTALLTKTSGITGSLHVAVDSDVLGVGPGVRGLVRGSRRHHVTCRVTCRCGG